MTYETETQKQVNLQQNTQPSTEVNLTQLGAKVQSTDCIHC